MHGAKALALVVDSRHHAEEIARFHSYIVTGPRESDCAIWIGAIGADGYGRFHLNRDGYRFCIRPHRYALALSIDGGVLEPDVLALHECDNPICTRVGDRHIVAGTQSHNMLRMVRMQRGGAGLHLAGHGDRRHLRRERSVALREAVRHGWDRDAVEDALLGDQPRLW